MTFLKRRDSELMIMVLRLGGGSVFLWFGIDKWIHPESWFGYIPNWFWPLSPVGAEETLIILGILEFLIGAMLIMGKYVREAAILAVVQLFAILVVTGANEVTVRDVGLMGIYLALIIEDDRRAKWRIPPDILSWIGVLFVVVVFFVGILYLRSA